MAKHSKLVAIFAIFSLFLFGCQSQSEQTIKPSDNQAEVPQVNLPVSAICKKPAPVADIWKLEKMLIKKGDIKESMDKSEREKVIKAYIAKKNRHYQLCLKGGNKK